MSNAKLAAATVLMRRGEAPYEVYLVLRNRELSFLGGFHAFPGGTTCPADHIAPLGGPTQDRDRASTAVRELFEETGVLCIPGAEAVSKEDRETLRQALINDDSGEPWVQFLTERGLNVDTQLLHPFGEWQTPPYTPVIYHALYYGVWLPEGEDPTIWDGELTDGAWYTPQKALEAHHQGKLFISYPVLETIKAMVRHGDSLEDARAELIARQGTHPRAGGELLNGVHVCPVKTFTLPPATHTNCYVLGGRELVVVDPATPMADEQGRLLDYLKHLESDGAKVKEIWLTHQHKDHIGAVEFVREALGVPVAAHQGTADSLTDIAVDRLIKDNEVCTLELETGAARWRALHTPGHARGHLCFYEENLGTLISGDNVLGMGTVVIAPPEGDMAHYLESLNRLLDLDIGFLLPAHGPPIAAAKEKIQFYIDHRLAREATVLATLTHEPRTPDALVPEIYVDTDPRAFPLAALNVLAHLKKLVGEGKAMEKDGGYERA